MTLDEAIQHSESLAKANAPDMYHGMIVKYLRELKEAHLNIQKLEKEADWLATRLEERDIADHLERRLEIYEIGDKADWRKAAREAVEKMGEKK